MAKKFSCLLFILCTLICVLNVTGQIIPLGAILDPNTRKGREEEIAIKLAVKEFSSIYNSTNYRDLNSTDPLLSSNYAQELIGLGAQIIISSGTIPQVFYAADVGNKAKVPIVSLIPSSLPSKPFLAQMSYPDAAFISCIVAIVKSFNWRRVIAVYEDDEYGTMSNTALLFSRALNEVGSELEYSAVFEPLKTGSDPKPSIQTELEEMKKQLSTVYVVLRSSNAFALSLFQEATAKEMMGAGSVWICGNDVTSLLDSTFDQSFISHYMQGVLGVESYINVDNTGYPTFSSTFKQAFKKEFENKGETVFAPGVFAFRAYDIVQAIAKASVMSQMNGKSLVENLMDTNFTGFSRGNISVFRLINVVGYSYKELGFWLDGFGFCGNEAELRARSYSQNLNVVFWPGGLKTNPGGLRKLRVGLPANPVWEGFVTVSVDKNRIVTDPTGFCIDVFTKVLERMESNNYKIEYEYVPFLMRSNSSFDYEYNPRNGNKSTSEFTYDDLVNQVDLKKVDIVIGDVTILSSRSQNVSFTEPFLFSGLAMLVPLEHDNPRWLLLRPFEPKLWWAIFGLMFCIFLSVWYLERHDNEADADFHGPWYKQIGATLWIIGNTIFQTYGDKIGTYYTKTVIVCWLLIVLILSACYTANLSSILVVENLKPRFNDSKIGCDRDSFVKNYLSSTLGFNQQIIEVSNNSDYHRAIQNGTISAAYVEVPYLRVFLSKYEGYSVFGKIHNLGGFGFVLPKFSSMTFDMSKAILELQEDGNMTSLEDKYFQISFNTTMSSGDETNKQRLDLASFTSLFAFCSSIVVGTVVIFKIRKKIQDRAKIVPEIKDEEMEPVEPVHNDQDHKDIEGQGSLDQ